ncbi:hypothetical protein ACFQ1S_32705 [Kibdelosporangium lantanae]|uniref:Uncharacterized protein n=1 Tax=Kibdelosporangium lantanae TaxID=1497396 RepID=A0ABW3MIP4_9PSEU
MRTNEWVNRWDAQQERYVPDREERFAVLCDVVEATLTGVPSPVVLDVVSIPKSEIAPARFASSGAVPVAEGFSVMRGPSPVGVR